MQSHISYTPFETLKLCQSIVLYGDDSSAFETIANELNASALIRESGSYDADRLTASALHALYTGLIQEESNDPPKINGDAATDITSAKKRKLSTSPRPEDDEQEQLVPAVVEKLYARFREETIKEIRREEEEYLRLEKEIKELEAQQEPISSAQSVISQGSGHAASQHSTIQDGVSPHPQGQRAGAPPPGPVTARPPQAADAQRPANAISPHPQQHSTDPLYNRNVPSPIPGRSSVPPQPMAPQHGYPPGPPGHQMMPYAPAMQQMPPPMDYSGRKASSATSTPARGSPVPQPPQQYPPYQHYQAPPQWPQQYPQQHPYPPHMAYPNQGYYGQTPTGRQHAPYPPTYQPYPQAAPVHYQQPPHGWHQSPSHSPHPQPHSAVSTPGPHLMQRPLPRTPGSSTPWKRKSLPPNNLRPPSPTRPDRGISPFSDTEADEVQRRGSSKTTRKAATPKRETAPARRGRPSSVAASGRSQSVASQRSETPSGEPSRRSAAVKVEAPSTPLPESTDATREQRSSGRRGHMRNTPSASATRSDITRSNTTNKRKRSSPVTEIATPPSLVDPARIPDYHSTLYPTDSSLILVSKNFAKTSQLVLNEISSHKLGGVFAKPLTERDAPGYKDLVLRPQDLKSIKTAVSKGSRAAIAAIESLDDREDEKGEAQEFSRDTDGQGALGNGFYLIRKSDELEPPKGIANAAQLQMELMRVFANAIMFNPLPQTQRGFGRNLRLRKRGGDVLPREREDTAGAAAEDDATENSSPSEESEGESADTGIIADAREMFEDVRKQVEAWRDLEKERQKFDGMGDGDAKGRQESVISTAAEDGGVNTPIASKEAAEEGGRGMLRKRRKLAAE